MKNVVYFCIGLLAGSALMLCYQAPHPFGEVAGTIDPLLMKRRSLRALSGREVTEVELQKLFDAARWAPSSYNNQPWRFLYAPKTSAQWNTMLDLMVPFNKSWAQNSGALIVVLSQKQDAKGRPLATASFDTGAAVQNLALQAAAMGLVAHTIEGFDYPKTYSALSINPDQYKVEAIVVVGEPGSPEILPVELREGEIKRAPRNPVEAIAFKNVMPS